MEVHRNKPCPSFGNTIPSVSKHCSKFKQQGQIDQANFIHYCCSWSNPAELCPSCYNLAGLLVSTNSAFISRTWNPVILYCLFLIRNSYGLHAIFKVNWFRKTTNNIAEMWKPMIKFIRTLSGWVDILFKKHYSDVIISAIAPQITGVLIAQPFVEARIKENIKAPRHWPMWGNPPVIGGSPHKGPVTRKILPFDDVIMNIQHFVNGS